MGNASHTQHPVAAQGLNLGIRDVAVFLEMMQSAMGKSPIWVMTLSWRPMPMNVLSIMKKSWG